MTIITESGKDGFNMAIFGGYWERAYIAGVPYEINEYYFNDDEIPTVTVPGLDYIGVCNRKLVIIKDGICYEYSYADNGSYESNPCYENGYEKWYPICISEEYVTSWDAEPETYNQVMKYAFIDDKAYDIIAHNDSTDGEYYLTFRGVKYLCDKEVVINKDGVFYVYPYCSTADSNGNYFYWPAAKTYSRMINVETVYDFNINETADGVQYGYEVSFDEDHAFRVSKPEVREGKYYYTIAYHDNKTKSWKIIAKDINIPGGIFSLRTSGPDSFEITDNGNSLSSVTFVWKVDNTGNVTKVYAISSGDTFAEAHPDKIETIYYDIFWYDDNSEIQCLSGSRKNMTYNEMICGGNIKRVDSSTVIPHDVRSQFFTVCIQDPDNFCLMRIEIFKNGYLKYYTNTSRWVSSYYELYYNPEGYDLDKLFMSCSNYTGTGSDC
ncbi:MAG: hypothetical protein EOM87_09510, partial [Clostridia bacterium]|nr:hypothetical protein [Clostridia bacterium]